MMVECMGYDGVNIKFWLLIIVIYIFWIFVKMYLKDNEFGKVVMYIVKCL